MENFEQNNEEQEQVTLESAKEAVSEETTIGELFALVNKLRDEHSLDVSSMLLSDFVSRPRRRRTSNVGAAVMEALTSAGEAGTTVADIVASTGASTPSVTKAIKSFVSEGSVEDAGEQPRPEGTKGRAPRLYRVVTTNEEVA